MEKQTSPSGWRRYESKVYGALHIAILVLSVFLIITISIRFATSRFSTKATT